MVLFAETHGRVCCIERLRKHRTYMHQTKFRSQNSDNMEICKAEMGRVRERIEERKRQNQNKEETASRNVRKVAKHCVFPMIYGSGGSKSRLAKGAGAEPSGQMRK